MRRLTLALALIALAVPSATASNADTSQIASAPIVHACHHGTAATADIGLDV